MNLSFIRIVGQISQTVQCVDSGQAVGTSHLKAKVVCDLSKLFQADCLASKQLSDKLMQTNLKPPVATLDPDLACPVDTRSVAAPRQKKPGISDDYSNMSL